VNFNRKHPLTISLLFTVYFSASLCGQDAASSQADTTKPTPKPLRKQSLEGPVLYEAQDILNLVDGKKTILTGKAKAAYQDMTLTAAKITVDWNLREMLAEGVPDSVWTRNEEGDSVRVLGLTGLPEFTQADDVMKGEVMTFNFKTKRGRVLRGRTKFEDGYYHGDSLKMMNTKIMNVADGRFTTCDRDSCPHYQFWSKKMKILVNDKVIAKPIVLFAGHIPVLALPFGLFPVKKGRHSGFLIPRYGESSLEGRYLRGIGYYWAPSEHWDVKPTLDFFEKSGFLFGADLNYNIRYKLSGRVYGSWTRKNFSIDNQKERRWDLNISHRQQLSAGGDQLIVSANLVSSSNFYRQLSPSREFRLQQNIRSDATLTKRLGGSWSVTANLNQTRNLKTPEVSESMPRLSIRGGQTPIFPKPKAKRGGRAETHWYNQIYMSYSSEMLSKRSVRLSDAVKNIYTESKGKGWDHSMRFSSSQKVFGWLNWNPSVSYRETWYDHRNAYALDPLTNKAVTLTQNGFFARRTYDVSASFSTKIYGTFYPSLFKNAILRHEARPTIGVSYQPDFGDSRYGYFQSVEDTAGKITLVDRFDNLLFSGTPREGRKGLNIGLSNLFQMKIGEGEKAKKIDLFNYDLSTAYNWKAKDYKFSDLSSTFRANPSQNIDVSWGARYSFYQTNAAGTRISKLWTDRIDWGNWKSVFGSRWLRLTYFSADVSFRLAGKAGAGGESAASASAPESPFDASSGLESLRNVPGDRFDPYAGMGSRSDFSIPWNLSGSLSYSDDRGNPNLPRKTFWIRSSLDFNLTKNWKVSYDTQVDLKLKKAVSQDISLFRDLHCWEAQVLWTPTGYNKRIYFRINIKSPMLKELKYEKGTGSRGLYGY
jgi:hypothetical protein